MAAIRFHDSLPFADSSSQDMVFWRQRVATENRRITTPSTFAAPALAESLRHPFRDPMSGLFRRDDVLGVTSPNLASYRAAVQRPRPFANPADALSSRASPNVARPFYQIPYRSIGIGEGSVEERVARGVARLAPLPPLTAVPTTAPCLRYEAPHIGASVRRGVPRARLDARMYAPSAG